MSESWLLSKIEKLERLHDELEDRVEELEKEVEELKQRTPPVPSHVPAPRYGPTYRQQPKNPFSIMDADKN
jgi:cell division septum initiation protein DivIVA